MRLLVLAVLAALAVLYFTVGLRFGYVTLTETQLFNATGTNTYVFRTLEDRQQVGVTGTCRVRSGRATLRLFGPTGTQVAGQVCQKGEWSLNVMGSGKTGNYRLEVEFDKYTGSINLNETRAGE